MFYGNIRSSSCLQYWIRPCVCNRNHKPLKTCHVKGWLSQDVTNYLKKKVSEINNRQKRLVRKTGKSNEWWEKVIRPPQCVTTQLGSVCALPKVVMSLSGNKVLMTLNNTPLLKLEPSIQLGQCPALSQRLPAPLWLPHSSIITQFFFLRSTHPAGYRGSAAAKTMQPTHLKDSDFLCHHPPRSLPSGSDHRASRETLALFLTLSFSMCLTAESYIGYFARTDSPDIAKPSHVSAMHVNSVSFLHTCITFWHISEHTTYR